MTRRLAVLALAAACGRAGFDPIQPNDVVSTGDAALPPIVLPSRIAYLKAAAPASSDGFGASVAVSADGRTIAIGANAADPAGLIDAGAVFVFERIGDSWAQVAELQAVDAAAGDRFGSNVAISADGGTVVVGAPQEDSDSDLVDSGALDTSAPDAGAAYVFARDGGWHQTAYLKAPGSDGADGFGAALAISTDGSVVVVSSPSERGPVNATVQSGAAFTFVRGPSSWTFDATVRAANSDAGDTFGNSVALRGDGRQLVIGALAEDSAATGVDGNEADNSVSDVGAVYTYDRVGAAWQQGHYLKPAVATQSYLFGESVSMSRDGSTLAVGAVGDAVVDHAGLVVLLAGATGAVDANVYEPVRVAGNQFGARTAIAADGRAVLAATPLAAMSGGAAYLFDGDQLVGEVRPPAVDPGDTLGAAVATADDASVLVVGAPGEDSAAIGVNGDAFDNSLPGSGCVWVLY